MIFIWIVSVFLYYAVDETIGEKAGYFTILEVVGFIFLVIGFLLYTKVIKINKLFTYPTRETSPQNKEEALEIMMEENTNHHSPLVKEDDGDF